MVVFCVMASGGGSNFEAILRHIRKGTLQAKCRLLITNNSRSGAVEIAKENHIPVVHISGKTHPDPSSYEAALLNVFKENQIQAIVLAGYMKALPVSLIKAYSGRILNIHPSLLPKFGGAGFYGIRVHKAVLDAGEKVTGATVHLVTEHYDEGPVIARKEVPVKEDDTPETLAARVLEAEHELYPKILAEQFKKWEHS